MKTSIKWFEGVKTPEQKKEIRASLLAAKAAFDRLADIIEKEKKSGINYRLNKDKYDMPGWAYLQADGVGEERAYNNILKLLQIRYEEQQ